MKITITHLLVMVALLLFASITSFAQQFVVDGIKYNIISETSVEVIENDPAYFGVVTIPTSVTNSSDTYSVTSIASYAFLNCPSIISITIPTSVTSIASEAFKSCTGLTSITIPNSVTSIGDYAFDGCSNLNSVTVQHTTPLTLQANTFTNIAYPTTLYVPAGGSMNAYKAAAVWQDFTDVVEIVATETFEVNGVKYKIISGTTNVEVIAKDPLYNGAVSILSTVQFDNKTYSVTTIGLGAFENSVGVTSISIPNSVTSILDGAFQGCEGLTSITIPNSVTNIGKFVFSGCSVLATVNMSTSVTSIGESAFWDCKALTNFTIPASVTTIEAYAFGNSGLTSITIPNTVTSFGDYAFAFCTGLSSITIPATVTSIGDHAFDGCTNLSSVTVEHTTPLQLQANTFTAIASPATLHVPTGTKSAYQTAAWPGFSNIVETISCTPTVSTLTETACGSYVFNGKTLTTSGIYKDTLINVAGCDSVVTLNLTIKKPTSSTLTETTCGKYFFNGADRTTSGIYKDTIINVAGCDSVVTLNLTINNANFEVDGIMYNVITGTTTVEVIAKYPYYTGAITIPSTVTNSCSTYSVTSIGYTAFFLCTNLTSVYIPNSVKSIRDFAFSNCYGLTSVRIPNSVTSIANHAFEKCTGLTSVTIPNSVKSIGDYAFTGCTNLKVTQLRVGGSAVNERTSATNIVIPNSVTSIGTGAFMGCIGLTNITIPSSVTSMGDSVFYDCTSLSSITLEHTSPLTLLPNTFKNVPPTAVLYVPAGALATYQNDPAFAKFTTIVESQVTGIESSTVSNLSIYPNPATDNVTITFTESVSGTVSIVDLHGNVVATKSISGNTSNISTAELASGVYVVKISSDKGVAVKQLVIQ